MLQPSARFRDFDHALALMQPAYEYALRHLGRRNLSRNRSFEAAGSALETVECLFGEPFHDPRSAVTVGQVGPKC